MTHRVYNLKTHRVYNLRTHRVYNLRTHHWVYNWSTHYACSWTHLTTHWTQKKTRLTTQETRNCCPTTTHLTLDLTQNCCPTTHLTLDLTQNCYNMENLRLHSCLHLHNFPIHNFGIYFWEVWYKLQRSNISNFHRNPLPKWIVGHLDKNKGRCQRYSKKVQWPDWDQVIWLCFDNFHGYNCHHSMYKNRIGNYNFDNPKELLCLL